MTLCLSDMRRPTGGLGSWSRQIVEAIHTEQLVKLHSKSITSCLKPGGVLFSSNPRGHNEEGWNDGRYGTYLDLETWDRFVSSAAFVEVTHYYRPAGLPLERQPWLASVWRR